MDHTKVAIVGGGPAGMVLGLLLARAGVEVTVLEKHADFLRDFRGDTVHPSTLQLLDDLGLGEKFAALPHSKLSQIAFPYGENERLVIGEFTRLNLAHPYIAMVPQWDLLDLLADAAQAEPQFTLRMRTEVTGLIQEAGEVRGVRYRTADGVTGELRADLAVACDGRSSIVRREAGLRPREYPVPIDAWWFRLPRTESDAAPAIAPRMTRGHAGVVIPREGFFQIAYVAGKGRDAELRAQGVESFRRRIAELLPWMSDRVDAIGSMDEIKHLDIRVNRLRRWHRPGLLCIGDAAHAMSPIGGVGINLAVQDAVAAAHLLAEPLRSGTVTEADLAKVLARRWLPTVVVQGLQRVLHRVVVEPVIAGRRSGPPKPVLLAMRHLPWLRAVPAYLIGVGIRPESAPGFARRP